MYFEIVGEIAHVETFATGSSIRELARLRKFYGRGRWRKRKGIARVRLSDGAIRLADYTGTKPTASAVKNLRSSATSTEPMKAKQFVVCLKNDGYEVSLERRKIYQVLPDPEAAKHRQVRVIDESGEDYLYPQNFFAPIELPQPIRRAVLAAV
jgi:hypothetical protein